MKLWLNGALLDAEAARIDPFDRGLTLGDGLFETILCRHGHPLWLDRHLARLGAAAQFLGIPLEWAEDDIVTAVAALIAAEQLVDGAIRITLTRGPAPRGLAPPAEPMPTLIMTAAAGLAAPAPVRAIIATVTRRNQASPLSRLKTLNALDNILARREAAERGADDAILVNTADRVAEASAANLFIAAQGVLRTPPLAEGALAGIARALLIEQRGAIETTLTPADLVDADAVFLTNSLGLRPVASIDGIALAPSAIDLQDLAALVLGGTTPS
jgi:branched-chain amino acid aminotransferase